MNEINWDEVESATATEEGLQVTFKPKEDGTLGAGPMVIAPGAQNQQRLVFCRKMSEVLNSAAQVLHKLQELNSMPPAGQASAAIASQQAYIALLQDLARKNGCG